MLFRSDRGCRFPGCSNTHYVDAHHIHHWAKGGETKLSNLVQLCRFHHRQVHEGRVVVQILDDGALRFVKPNGESFDSIAPDHTRPLSDWQQLPEDHQQLGIQIDPKTATTRWRGEQMDYGLAVDVLLQHSRRKPPDNFARGAGAECAVLANTGEFPGLDRDFLDHFNPGSSAPWTNDVTMCTPGPKPAAASLHTEAGELPEERLRQ